MKSCFNSGLLKAIYVDGVLRVRIIASLVAIVLAGCSDKSEVAAERSPLSSEQNGRTVIRNEADLRRILIPGMSTNAIVAQFGKPRPENVAMAGTEWRYGLHAFPADGEMPGTHVIGLVIGVTNGHLERWGCTYVGESAKVMSEEVLLNTENNSTSATLKFFTVHSNSISQGRYIDTERLPKLGFISSSPDLIIGRLRKAILEERTATGGRVGQGGIVWVFNISLNQEDTERLKTMSTTNVSKKVLIMVEDEPVVAPMIMAPLETGQFELECDERSLMELVKKQLGRLEQGQVR
jgi:hypothetical protein